MAGVKLHYVFSWLNCWSGVWVLLWWFGALLPFSFLLFLQASFVVNEDSLNLAFCIFPVVPSSHSETPFKNKFNPPYEILCASLYLATLFCYNGNYKYIFSSILLQIHSISYMLQYLKAVLPKLLIFTSNSQLSWFEPFSQQAHMHHTWKQSQAVINKGPIVILKKNSLKSGGWAFCQLKLQYNFDSKAASWSLDLTATPVLID